MNWYDRARYGIISTYTYGGAANPQTIDSIGDTSADVGALAAAFDVDRFASDAEKFGAEYVVFTAWHYAMYVLYPSAVMATWLTDHASERDLIADLIAALAPRGIRLMLYIHPSDGHDLTASEQTATGWNDATGDYATWVSFINALVTELGQRYGTGIDGYWVDAISNDRLYPHKVALRASLLAGNPARVLVGNIATDDPSNSYTSDLMDRCSREYYWQGEGVPGGRPASIEDWTPSYNQTCTLAVDTAWWAIRPKTGADATSATPAQLARYSVLQAGCNIRGGGILWGAGPYSGSDVSIWEPDVEATLTATAASLAPLAASLRGVLPSRSYATPNTVTLTTLDAFVATMSADRSTEYIHVLNPPTGGLTLPAPVGWTRAFTGAVNLGSGRPVALEANPGGGYVCTLDPADTWSPVDTVIALARAVPNTGLVDL